MKELQSQIRSALDEGWLVKTTYLDSRGWLAVPVYEGMAIWEAQWLSDAIQLMDYDQLIALKYDSRYTPDVKRDLIEISYSSDRGSIMAARGESWESVVFTNVNCDFMTIEGGTDDFRVVCGRATFVRAAIGMSYDTARLEYFNGVNSMPENWREGLAGIWDRYAAYSTP